jgi:hypothetical protein
MHLSRKVGYLLSYQVLTFIMCIWRGLNCVGRQRLIMYKLEYSKTHCWRSPASQQSIMCCVTCIGETAPWVAVGHWNAFAVAWDVNIYDLTRRERMESMLPNLPKRTDHIIMKERPTKFIFKVKVYFENAFRCSFFHHNLKMHGPSWKKELTILKFYKYWQRQRLCSYEYTQPTDEIQKCPKWPSFARVILKRYQDAHGNS